MCACVLHGGDMGTSRFPLEDGSRLQRVVHASHVKEVWMTKMTGHESTGCVSGMQK